MQQKVKLMLVLTSKVLYYDKSVYNSMNNCYEYFYLNQDSKIWKYSITSYSRKGMTLVHL